MKTYQEFIQEALLGKFVKTVAKQLYKSKALKAAVKKSVPKVSKKAPEKLKFGKTFHGTTKSASDAISKGGWRTDTNVTRQMAGSKVYTAGDNYSAANYAHSRAARSGDKGAMRQFRIPQSVVQKQTTKVKGGAGDYSGKGYKMTTLSPQQANKYDVTDTARMKNKYDIDAVMSPDNKRELIQRVRAALRKKPNVDQLKKELGIKEKELKTGSYRNVGVGRRESL
jgi:hypothetical protein|tara:strand:- start:695 stop:1369 length:675 start_codon:yes stop_codon:yes gene_type:complete